METLKRFFKSTTKVVMIVTALFFGLYLLLGGYDNIIASSPRFIALRAGLWLPSYTIVEQEDNLDRSSSAWSACDWTVKLNNQMNTDDIDDLKAKMDSDKGWTYDKSHNAYQYRDDSEEQYVIITFYPDTGIVQLGYMWYDFFA